MYMCMDRAHMLETIETFLGKEKSERDGVPYKSNGKDARTGVKIQFVPLVGQPGSSYQSKREQNIHIVSFVSDSVCCFHTIRYTSIYLFFCSHICYPLPILWPCLEHRLFPIHLLQVHFGHIYMDVFVCEFPFMHFPPIFAIINHVNTVSE